MAGKSSEAGHHKEVNESLQPCTSSAISTASSTTGPAPLPLPAVVPTANPLSSGKTLQLPLIASTCKNSDASCSSKFTANAANSSLLHCCTKRSHHNSNISSSAKPMAKSNLYHQLDTNCKSPSQQQQYFAPTHQSTIKIVSNFKSCPFHRAAVAAATADDAPESIDRARKMCVTTSQVMATAPKTSCTIKKESLSCDSISKTTFACAERAESIFVGSEGSVISNNDASPISEHRNASLLSVNSGTSACGSSGSSCGNNISSTSTVTASNSPMISLSKSETNIFESNNGDGTNKMSVFSVVSLNGLNECDPFLNRPMNDLSKTQCLNQISDHDLSLMNDHMRPLTLAGIASQKITVSVKNPADFSEKYF